MLEEKLFPSRSRFTDADFDFVASVLAPEGTSRHLAKLWSDPDGLRELLDLQPVFHHLIDSPEAIRVSPHFYFYVLIRHSFLQNGLTEPALAQYVTGVMTRRISATPRDPLQDTTCGFTHASDFLPIIAAARQAMRFHLHVAAGNQFLILTGLYPEFLRSRSERGEAPGLEFYESFARQSYECAASNRHVACTVSRQLLGHLAEALPDARRSLNRVAEEFVFLGD